MRRQRSRPELGPAGFTLIEVMVGMLILVIGLLAISTMVPTAFTNLSSSAFDTQALAFAQKRLDELRALSYGDSALSSGTHNDSAPATGYTQSYVVEVDPTLTPAVTGTKRVTVTVTGPRSRQVQLITLITQ